MSFLKITDPQKRDSIVSDYINTMKRIQNRNMSDKVKDLVQEQNLNSIFKPIIKSSSEAVEKVKEDLHPIKNELKNISEGLERNEGEFKLNDERGELLMRIMEMYDIKVPTLDPYFGIYNSGKDFRMGNKEVKLDEESNIYVDGIKYDGTHGLWHLIMDKAYKAADQKDLENYKKLVLQTNVMKYHLGREGKGRPKSTYKYRTIFSHFVKTEDKAVGDGSTFVPIVERKKNIYKSKCRRRVKGRALGTANLGLKGRALGTANLGHGITFLPSSIKSLRKMLTLLLGSYQAGNRTSTRNQITAIVDELQRRKSLPVGLYKYITNYISPT